MAGVVTVPLLGVVGVVAAEAPVEVTEVAPEVGAPEEAAAVGGSPSAFPSSGTFSKSSRASANSNMSKLSLMPSKSSSATPKSPSSLGRSSSDAPGCCP